MKNYNFYFEIKNLLTQFVSAFDDCLVKRYDNDRVAQSTLEVRYVLAPKQRVLYDIINEQHNITLPVVCVNVNSITRDEKRVFNKLDGFYLPTAYKNPQRNFAKVSSPVPVNIDVSMSIIGKYQADVDQIISNFAPYNNPYIILAWKLPEEFGLGYDAEIRSKVLWNGSINFTPPVDLTSTDKYRVVADTSFTIEGWLFKQKEELAPIYVVNATFNAVSGLDLNYGSYNALSGVEFPGGSDTFSVSGVPAIKNIYLGLENTGAQLEVTQSTSMTNNLSSASFMLLGEFYTSLKYLMLSSNNISLFPGVTSIDTIKDGTITGSLVENYTVINDGIITFTLPYTSQSGDFVIVTANDPFWDSSAKTKNIVFSLN